MPPTRTTNMTVGKGKRGISLSTRFALLLAEETNDGKELCDFLMKIFRDPHASMTDRQWAFDRISDRLMGKANQTVSITGSIELSAEQRPNLATLTLEELDELERITAKTITVPDKPKALTQ